VAFHTLAAFHPLFSQTGVPALRRAACWRFGSGRQKNQRADCCILWLRCTVLLTPRAAHATSSSRHVARPKLSVLKILKTFLLPEQNTHAINAFYAHLKKRVTETTKFSESDSNSQ